MDRMATREAVAAALADATALQERLKGLLADLDGTEKAVTIGRQGRWTYADVERIWAKSKHLPGIRALFEVTAEKPGEMATYAEILERSGLDEQQQRNEHARLSRISTELFGEKRWPIDNKQGGHDSATGTAQSLYWMDPQIAEWWRDLHGDR